MSISLIHIPVYIKKNFINGIAILYDLLENNCYLTIIYISNIC